MIQEERLKKICDDFNLLNDKQQDYILGILQALVFANKTKDNTNPESNKIGIFDN